MRAVLSIGSNLGDRLATLQLAVDRLRPWVRAVSAVYETAPWGPVPQADYLNAVILVDDPAAGPQDWLDRAHAAEQAAGRVREQRWGPRTLDVDVIDVEGRHSADPELTLPHPRAAQRLFVLRPWSEVDPDATLLGVAVREQEAARSAAEPDEAAGVRRRPELRLR